MDTSTYRKYYLNSRLLCVITMLLAFVLNLKAENTDDSLIRGVTYTYDLFYNSQDRLDCCGTLKLSISLPANTDKLIFERTAAHLVNADLDNLHFGAKSTFPANTELIKPDIYWGTYFRVWAILTDGIWIGSSIYSINDYINQSDLNALLNSASIEDTYTDEVSLHINNKELYVDTPDTLHIFIFDLYGMEIFSGDIYRPIVIPLDNINSPLIITKYQTSNTIKTKKLLVQ